MKTSFIIIISLFCFTSNANVLDSIFFEANNIKEDSLKIEYLINQSKEIQLTNPKLSLKILEEADSIAIQLNHSIFIARIKFDMGLLNFNMGNYNDGLFLLNDSYSCFKFTNNQKGMAKSMNQIGSSYLYLGNYPEAMNNFYNSIRLYEKINDSIGISNSYSNIGIVLSEQMKYNEALKFFFKSVNIDKSMQYQEKTGNTYLNIGMVYFEIAEYDSAIYFLNESLKLFEVKDDYLNIASCYTNIALIYEELGSFDEALSYYENSLKLYKKVDAKQGIASSLFNIGFLNFVYGDLNTSKKYFKEAQRIGLEIGSVKDIALTSEKLSDIYMQEKNYKEAYNNFVLYHTSFQKLTNEDNIRKLTQIEMQYDFDKKKKEIEFQQQQKEIEHQAKLKRQRIIVIAMSFGVLFLIVFAIFIYRSYKRKQRDNILLSQQKEEITDSIHYAKRIQSALLPPDEMVHDLLSDYFIYYQPRDIVSGDYYWIAEKNSKIAIVAADCTGHGVPGAFMSMLGMSFLNEIINQSSDLQSNFILDELRKHVIKALRQKGESGEAKDGMDLALIVVDIDKKQVQFSGAYNPLYLIRNNELIQYKADKMPIGISDKHGIPFTNTIIEFNEGDCFYMFSDGYVDQFGGPDYKKFKSKNFQKLLVEIQDKSMQHQKEILHEKIQEWKGTTEQIDDIIVIGVRL